VYNYDSRNSVVSVYVEVAENENYSGGFKPVKDYHYNMRGL